MTFENVLKQAGFQHRRSPAESDIPIYFYDSPRILVEATHYSAIWSLGLEPGWGIIPNFKNGRTIQFEPYYIPEAVDSYEQGLAVLSYSIRKLSHRDFVVVPDWYAKGLAFKAFLPWEIQWARKAAEYDALPKVHLEVKWMRVLRDMLKDWQGIISSEELIAIDFNGHFLTFSSGDHRIPIPGHGKPWSTQYFLKGDVLKNLPKRIYERQTMVLIKNNHLRLGNHWYKLLLEDHRDCSKPEIRPDELNGPRLSSN